MPYIEEWVNRTGAPQFEIREARVEEGAPGEAPWWLPSTCGRCRTRSPIR